MTETGAAAGSLGSVLRRIDAYADAVARRGADAEPCGRFVIFRTAGGLDDRYARPAPGAGAIGRDDVLAVVRRQAALGLRPAIEWIATLRPDLAGLLRDAGLAVTENPLLVLGSAGPVPDTPGGRRRRGPVAVLLGDADPDLAAVRAVQDVAFSDGTVTGASPRGAVEAHARGVAGHGFPGRRSLDRAAERAAERAGAAARDRAVADVSAALLADQRSRLASGSMIGACVRSTAGSGAGAPAPVSAGTAQLVGDVAEITGIATLPGFRGRGHARAVTVALATAARDRGATLVYLSAEDAGAARLYLRCGFAAAGVSGTAVGDPPGPVSPGTG